MNQKGLIIYFEGPDGVGKTTQLELAEEALKRGGYKVYITRTMGGTPLGEMLRQAFLSENPRPAETDLYIAMAAQHAMLQDVLERRSQGEIVLIDRSPLSIIGYQVHGEGMDSNKGYQAAGELMELFKPDMTLMYWTIADVLEKRRTHRNHIHGHDFFENKPLDFHQKVTEGFKEAAERFGAKMVDASEPIDHVHKQTMELIDSLLLP